MELSLLLLVYFLCLPFAVAAPPKTAPAKKAVLKDKPTESHSETYTPRWQCKEYAMNPDKTNSIRGHCDPVCSCQVEGHYYSEGERWVTPEDPCTVYQCLRNGLIEPISHGCSYKGECKAIESTWKDGCNTYICIEEGFVHYRLVEAGCSTDTGGCLRVGERTQKGCDILECQIDGGCLTVKKVLAGCTVEGGCKPVGSYWHDGCAAFTCAEEGDRTVERSVGNETMYWPEANFAMLKPQTGCPVDLPEKWSEGYRKHYGEGQNQFSIPLSLAGEHTLEYITHQFCVHQYQLGPPQGPRFTTYWEPGSYCLLRSGGMCPRGFHDGFVLLNDNDKKSTLGEASGTVPDGDFSTDTGLSFCCRGDGSVFEEITLPKDQSFVMFMNQGETECQKVKGMTNSIEFLSFDGSPSSAFVQNGSLPEVKFDNGDIILYLCVYKPMGCGCGDSDGTFVAVGTEKTVNCITKKCVSDRGISILQVVSAGCYVNGSCQQENAEWSVNRGETCSRQTCKKVLINNVETYEVVNVGDGCFDGDICRELGYERYKNCYTSICALDQNALKPVFKVKKADCPWQGTCKPVNSTWSHNCMTYRCDMNIQGGHYQWKIQPIEYGCNDGNKCYKVGDVIQGRCYQAECKLNSNKTVVYLDVVRGGCTWKDECKKVNETWEDGCHHFQCVWTHADTGFTAVVNATNVSCEWNNTCYQDNEVWTDGCVDYKCVVNRQEAEVKWGVETVRLGCRDFQNNCLAVGENVTEGCITYQCNYQGDRIGLDAIATGCEWNNSCKPENDIWTDDQKCVDYQCLKTPHQNGSVMQIKIINYACVFNNTCMPVNATWLDGCRTRKCVVRKTGKMIQRDTAPVSAGCDDEGVCRPVGYKKITPTCMTYECQFKDEFKDSFFTLSGGACRSRNGQCHDIGQTWDEKEPGICVKYKCTQNLDGHRPEIVGQSCRDVNGVCKPIGSTGFSAEVQGQLRSDCTCAQAQNKVIGVNISCAK